ncbi:helix-turn-helix domain-containing protein [Bacillus sp. NP157]|nr:helix-turn-helix domain-containing protein [Bacillus sp. NP157]
MSVRTGKPRPAGPVERKRVLILALPPVDALDVIGPAEVFAYANQLADGRTPYLLELVSPGDDVHVASETGIGLTAHHTLAREMRGGRPVDTLIVATGFSTLDQLDAGAVDWIRRRAPLIRRVCSICVGAFALAQAGVLAGRRATTHWRLAQMLAERFPDVTVDPSPIWVKDGNVYTSAGISSGIDLALALVAEDLGDDVALEIARNLVLYLRRPGGQAQFSVSLRNQAMSSELDALRHWIGEHLADDLGVERLADRQATSVRTLIRIFQRDLKTTPAKYVEEVRLEAVGRALERGGLSLEAIAKRCGYRSTDVMRKAFLRRYGVTPGDYARRFASEG